MGVRAEAIASFNVVDSAAFPYKLAYISSTTKAKDSAAKPQTAPLTYDSTLSLSGWFADSAVNQRTGGGTFVARMEGWREGSVDANRRLTSIGGTLYTGDSVQKFKAGKIWVQQVKVTAAPNFRFNTGATDAQKRNWARIFAKTDSTSTSKAGFGDTAFVPSNDNNFGLTSDGKTFTFAIAHKYVGQPIIKSATTLELTYDRDKDSLFCPINTGTTGSTVLPDKIYLSSAFAPWADAGFTFPTAVPGGSIYKATRTAGDSIVIPKEIAQLTPRTAPYDISVAVKDADNYGLGIDTAFKLQVKINPATVPNDSIVALTSPQVGASIPSSPQALALEGDGKGIASINIIGWYKGGYANSNQVAAGTALNVGDSVNAVVQVVAKSGYQFTEAATLNFAKALTGKTSVKALIGAAQAIEISGMPGVQLISQDKSTYTFAIPFKKVSGDVSVTPLAASKVYGVDGVPVSVIFPVGFPTSWVLTANGKIGTGSNLMAVRAPITLKDTLYNGVTTPVGNFVLSGLETQAVTTTPVSITLSIQSGETPTPVINVSGATLALTVTRALVTVSTLSPYADTLPKLNFTIPSAHLNLTPAALAGNVPNASISVAASATGVATWRTWGTKGTVDTVSNTAPGSPFQAGVNYVAIVKVTASGNHRFSTAAADVQGYATAFAQGARGTGTIISGSPTGYTLGVSGTNDEVLTFGIKYAPIGQPTFVANPVTVTYAATANVNCSLQLDNRIATGTLTSTAKLSSGAAFAGASKSVTVTKVATGTANEKTWGVFTLTGYEALSVAGSPWTIHLTVTGPTSGNNQGIRMEGDLAVTVVPKSLKNAGGTIALTLTPSALTYDGLDKKENIKVVVSDGSLPASVSTVKTLEEGKDYSLVWGSTVNVGTTDKPTNVLAIGAGNYKDTLTGTFSIAKAGAPAVRVVNAVDTLEWASTITLANIGLFEVVPNAAGLRVAGPDTFVVATVTNSWFDTAAVVDGSLKVDETGGAFDVTYRTINTTNVAASSNSVTARVVVLGRGAARLTVSNPANITVVQNHLRGSLSVTASANVTGTPITYTWFRVNATGADTKVGRDSTALELSTVPGLSQIGAYQFYAQVSSPGVLTKKSNNATVTVRSPDFSVSPVVATMNFSNQSAAFEFNKEFKVTTPTITIGDASVAGRAGDYKLTELTYRLNGAIVTQNRNNEGLSSGEIRGVTDVGVYDVSATMVNTAEGAVGWGLQSTKTITYTVSPRNMSNVTVSVAALQGTDAIYNGEPKDVEGRVTVTDGSGKTLVRGEDYTIVDPRDWTDAGTREVWVEGVEGGNYTGRKSGTFTITKGKLTLSTEGIAAFSKEYDGTTDVDTSTEKLSVGFVNDFGVAVPLLLGTDYSVTNLKYNSKDVGADKTISCVVALKETEATKNYTLASGAFTLTKQIITKGTPKAEHLTVTYGSPAKALLADGENQVLYDAKTKTVNVGWKSGISNTGSKITVNYGTDDNALPKEIGSYNITADVTAGSSFLAATAIPLGTLTIVNALDPIIVTQPVADTFYYAGASVALSVVAQNPKDGKTSGLSYQWYEVSDTGAVILKGKTSASLTINTKVTGSYTYQVAVTYKGSEQVTTTITSGLSRVTVYPEPVSLADAIVTISQVYEYTGSKIEPTINDLVVTLGGQQLQAGVDYDFASNAVKHSGDAGQDVGTVTIKGIRAYKDEARGTFSVNKIQVTEAHLSISWGTDYNGLEQPIKVDLRGTLKGLGAVTATYDPDTVSRQNAGTWQVSLKIEDGTNFYGVENLPLSSPYTIRKAEWSEELFNIVGFNEEGLKEVAFNGQDQGIAVPELTGLGEFYKGTYKLVYEHEGREVTRVVDSSESPYIVSLKIEGDQNFKSDVLEIGQIVIHEAGWVKIADVGREIPKSVTTEVGVIAPVTAVMGSVTVGPNPVESNGKVAIYWSGSKAVDGTLYVYNTVGKKIAAVDVKGTKKIGVWNAAGAPVGAYLLKGVLSTKDGSKVKVATVVGVGR